MIDYGVVARHTDSTRRDRCISDARYGSWTPMTDTFKRISAGFGTQGLMATLGTKLVFVSDGEM